VPRRLWREDELVEIDLEVLVADAAVGAVHPGLEVADRAVRARQQLLAGSVLCWTRRRWS